MDHYVYRYCQFRQDMSFTFFDLKGMVFRQLFLKLWIKGMSKQACIFNHTVWLSWSFLIQCLQKIQHIWGGRRKEGEEVL